MNHLSELPESAPRIQDGQPLPTTPSIGFGAPWPQWDPSAVTATELRRILRTAGDHLDEPAYWRGNCCVVDGTVLRPGTDGTYNLAKLGMTFSMPQNHQEQEQELPRTA